jgi:hypothetical protein
MIPHGRGRRTIRQERRWLTAASLLLVAFLSPYVFRGRHVHVRVHDNLDQPPLATARVLQDDGYFLAANDTPVPHVLSGVPRGCLTPKFNLVGWLYWRLDPFAAYVVNQMLMHATAFIGMGLMLTALMRRRTGGGAVCAGTALCFAMLPHYPPTGLSIPGMPLAAWAMLAIARRRDTGVHWICIAAYPFCSSFFVAPIFLYCLYAGGWLTDVVVRRRVNLRWLLALALMAFAVLLAEYPLLQMVFQWPDYVSHRVEFQETPIGFRAAWRLTWENFLEGQNHIPTLHWPVVGASVLLATVMVEGRYGTLHRIWKRQGRDRQAIRPERSRIGGFRARIAGVAARMTTAERFLAATWALVLGAWIVSAFYGYYDWARSEPLKQMIGPLNMIQWDRIHWLHPLIWYLAFGFALAAIARTNRRGRWIALTLIGLQVAIVWNEAEYRKYARMPAYPTYEQFFAEEQFEQIRDFIGRPASEYRVGSLGLHPSIALHNGFYCVDGYLANYPLSYKQAFRRVIAAELGRSPSLKAYYDGWGSRCYLFSADIQNQAGRTFLPRSLEGVVVRNLTLDTRVLRGLGGRYVLSAVPIERPERKGLRLLRIFEHSRSAWRIHLYEIPDPGAAE